MKTKKLIRTLQIYFSPLQDPLYSLRRFFRKISNTPFEDDFRALRLFPNSDENSEIFLDIGTNRGQSLDAIRMYRKNNQIIGFEPNKFLYKKLMDVYKKDKKLLINNFGLGDSNGDFTLYIPFYKQWMFDGEASLERDAAENILKDFDRIYFYEDRFLSLQEISIKIQKLDDLELSPFFIKIDVQGHELQVLKGAEKTLKTYEPIVLLESPKEDIIDFLNDLGYQFYRFEKNKFIAGTKGFPNTFFMTKSKSNLVDRYIRLD